MFISNFALKTTVQKVLFDLREIVDYPTFHPGRALYRAALDETVDYLRALPEPPTAHPTTRQLIDAALRSVEVEGPVLEFGVYKGATLRYIAKRVGPAVAVHGFDSFKGLPAAWAGNAFNFDAGGALPAVPNHVQLHVGYFSDTLPTWVEQNPSPVSFVFVDCDIYSSTKDIFDSLGSLIVPGTVLAFDEYFNYPGWRNHEFKAFQEFVAARELTYEYLGFSRLAAAVRIVSVG